jgi:lipopolysaccharide biosynthesis regulator YciM
MYEEALTSFSSDMSLLMRLGAWHQRHGQPTSAIQCYEAALSSGKVRASSVHARDGRMQAILRLGALYASAGSADRAQRLWLQFLAANPQAAAVRQALLALQSHSASFIATRPTSEAR